MNARPLVIVLLASVAGCATSHVRGGAGDASSTSEDASSMFEDASARADTDLPDATSHDADDDPDATADAYTSCRGARDTVSPISDCHDRRVPTTGRVHCTSSGVWVEVTSADGTNMRTVTIARDGSEHTTLCVTTYDDCTCGETTCVAPGEVFTLPGSHAYRRLAIENDGEPVRVIVCR